MLFNKKFDLIVSLGEDCACTSYLRRFNLQEYSYPFDWLTKASFQTRIELLVNNFENFLQKENMLPMQKPSQGLVDENHDYYKDQVFDFYFYHDFKSNIKFDDEFIQVKNKYERRIKRLYQNIEQSKNILFVWWSRDKHQDENVIIDSYKKLEKKFVNKKVYLLVIEPSQNHTTKYMCNNQVLIERFDNVSYKHNSKWNETMGNEKNNNKIFQKLMLNKTVKEYFDDIVYKVQRFLINFVPNKKIRKELRQNLKFQKFHAKL